MQSRRQFQQLTASMAAGVIATRGGFLLGQESPTRPTAKVQRTAVGESVAATVHPLATDAAIQMYKQGGNAIDAAVSAALCLSVVDGHNSGIGGGCLILVRTHTGAVHAIDGRETAPAAASPGLYVVNGKPSVEISQIGPLAVAVPGQVAALHLLHQKLGKLDWAKLFPPAIAAGENGYIVGSATHNAIASERKALSRFESSRATLLKADGKPIGVGDTLRQTELAQTMQMLAKNGPEWFYRGDFAKRCAEHLRKLGGVLTAQDMSNYKPVERTCIESVYRKFRIVGFPPPSSGGIHIAQMLNMLEHFDLRSLHRESRAKYFHVLAECMKRAFADRAHWLGDSDFVKVPDFLTDRAYSAKLVETIELDRVSKVDGHGDFDAPAIEDSKKHTTHLSTADKLGNWVAITSTINTSWGSKVMVPGTGVILNNQMDDFSIAPGVPNAFGLVGSEGNAIAPNKRPLSSMSPTIVLQEDGVPLLTCGAAGGPKIINATLQNIVGCLDLGLPMDRSIAMSRIHHQWKPDLLYCESPLGGERKSTSEEEQEENSSDNQNQVVHELMQLGYSVKPTNTLAIAQGIQSTPMGLLAASDPRTAGCAMSI